MRSGRIAFFVQVSLERDANKVLSSVESFMKRGGGRRPPSLSAPPIPSQTYRIW